MFRMFAQMFTMFAVLFNAGERGARALDNVATVAEEASEGYRDIERLKRQKKLSDMRKDLQLPTPDSSSQQESA